MGEKTATERWYDAREQFGLAGTGILVTVRMPGDAEPLRHRPVSRNEAAFELADATEELLPAAREANLDVVALQRLLRHLRDMCYVLHFADTWDLVRDLVPLVDELEHGENDRAAEPPNENVVKVAKAIVDFESAKNRSPSLEELAERLVWSERTAERHLKAGESEGSFTHRKDNGQGGRFLWSVTDRGRADLLT